MTQTLFKLIFLLLSLALNFLPRYANADICIDLFAIPPGISKRYVPVNLAERLGDLELAYQQDPLIYSTDHNGRMKSKSAKGDYDSEDRQKWPPKFKSIRKLHEDLAGNWNSEREMHLIPLYVNDGVENLKTTSAWAGFPEDLQKLFESGKYLSTANINTNEDQVWYAKYAVLMAAAPDSGGVSLDGVYNPSTTNGRTGVLMQKIGYKFVPVLIHDEKTNQDLLVEIKGVGAPDRKFENSSQHPDRGGLSPQFAENEFQNLENVAPKIDQRGAKALATFSFKNSKRNQRVQAMLLRLAPSNQRVSFREDPNFLRNATTNTPVDEQELDRRVAHFLGAVIAKLFANGTVLASHPENILVNAELNEFFLTDHSDMFSVDEFPKNLEGRTLTLDSMIYLSLKIVTELPTYNDKIHFAIFREAFAAQLSTFGLSPEILAKLSMTQSIRELSKLVNELKIYKLVR